MQDESNNQIVTHQDIFDEDKMLLEASLDAKDCFVHLKRMLGSFWVGILAKTDLEYWAPFCGIHIRTEPYLRL